MLEWGPSNAPPLGLLSLHRVGTACSLSPFLPEAPSTWLKPSVLSLPLHLPQFLRSRFCYVWGYPSYSPSCVPKGGTLLSFLPSLILRDLPAVCR